MIGIYKIEHNITKEYYIGASKDIKQRFHFHRLKMKKEKHFDCGWHPEDTDLSHYTFEVLEECSIDDLKDKEDFYILNADPILNVNIKSGKEQKSHRSFNHMSGKHWYNNGVESKVFYEEDVPNGWEPGRITGIEGLTDAPKDNIKKGTIAYEHFLESSHPHSEYIDTSDLDIKILSDNEFVPLKGILKNNKKASMPMCQVIYDCNGKQRALSVTIDHPLRTVSGRKEARNLTIGDFLIDAQNGKFYPIIGIKQISTKCDTFDVETDNDVFDLSGILSHNCRTRVYENRYNPDNITSFGRGNLSFTTINLPRLGIENGRINENGIDEFFKKLDEMMVLCKEQLLDRLQIQMKKKVKNFPFLMGQGIWVGSDKLNKEDELGDILKEGSLSIGFIGLAECLIALTGKHHGESIDAQKLGLDIVKHMRQMTDKFAEETGLNFSLFATPAEGLSFRFTDMDKKKYGIIKGITDKDYYTNSFHVPVYYDISLFEKIDIEAPYHALCNAGHITYVEVEGDLCKNPKAFETIVHYMMQKGIGYGAINHPVDRCTNCNYTGTITGDTCPACDKTEGNGTHIERIRRITGYLVGDMNRWNRGKKAEEKDRVKHDFSYRF